MSVTRPVAIGLVLLPLVGCAGLNERFLAPLATIEEGAGPLDPADAATAETAAAQLMSGVIAGDLLVGGEAASRMLAAPQNVPTADPEEVVPDESTEATAVRRVATRQDDRRRQAEESALLERWMSTRIAPAQLTRDDIRRAQQLLAGLGHAPGPIDGIVGPRTRAAVEAFQEARGLAVSGELTPALIDRLALEGS